ncbi:uncharacterized protein [Parasteatoda tepidariorum]|uniref:uncharacterized protein n=1 Tax=Parasteatoda tepidariorum TaxID=114398 RepID=UPI00077F8276|nr:uncharacterized protein LOC107447708 [Parasteatoda tepidariorum]
MMNRSFSPQHNSPRSPVNFSNRFRMAQFPSPYNSNIHPRMQYGSPQSSPSFRHSNNHYNQISDIRQRNSFDLPSPQFHSSPKVYSPRNNSPYGSYNSPNSSWNNQSKRSIGSSRNSSSYFADTSGSPYSISNKKQRYQDKKNRFSDSDSNPGHSFNIEDYIHPSMLDDPWEKDMIEYEKKKEQLSQTES